MWRLEEIRERLKAAATRAVRGGGPGAADLVRRHVRVGRARLPILNLAGLWALRALVRDGADEAEYLLKTLWVLKNQETERILDVAAEPPSPAELAAVGREVDLAALPDYAAALEEMFALIAKKKDRATTRA